MMLRALYELARRKELRDDPDFEKRRVDFVLEVDAAGTMVSLVATQDADGRGLDRKVPRAPQGRTVGIKPAFLVDNAQYTLGLTKLNSKDAARGEKCLAAFRQLVEAAHDSTNDEGLAAVGAFLSSLPDARSKVLAAAPGHEWTGDEAIAFRLLGDAGLVHERAAVRDYWSSQRAEQAGEGEPSRCLVTGELQPPARLHPAIKRVPQAQSSGAFVVSFNGPAFTSHGLEGGANAPVSRDAAEGYATALNWLLEGTEQRRFRYGVPLGDDAVVVFWTREESSLADDVLDLFAPDADEATRLAEAPWRGLAPSDVDVSPFYAITLGGNASRVVVRDWLETTAGEVKRSVRQYFDDLRLVGQDDRPIPIGYLLSSLEATPGARDRRGLPPALESRLFRSALQGTPLPRELLGLSLRRLRLPPQKNRPHSLRLQCSLIKATLLRLHRGDPTFPEVTVALDETNTSVPYLLGRLFAVLENLQGRAQGDVNATIRDRFFASASATPASVFPRLLRLSVHHAAKVDGGYHEQLKTQIIGKLPAERFPAVMPLDDQGLFAIGYYHQREAFFTKKTEGKATPEAKEVTA